MTITAINQAALDVRAAVFVALDKHLTGEESARVALAVEIILRAEIAAVVGENEPVVMCDIGGEG